MTYNAMKFCLVQITIKPQAIALQSFTHWAQIQEMAFSPPVCPRERRSFFSKTSFFHWPSSSSTTKKKKNSATPHPDPTINPVAPIITRSTTTINLHPNIIISPKYLIPRLYVTAILIIKTREKTSRRQGEATQNPQGKCDQMYQTMCST